MGDLFRALLPPRGRAIRHNPREYSRREVPDATAETDDTNPVIPSPPGLDPETLIKTLKEPDPKPFDVVRHVQLKPGVVALHPSWQRCMRPAMTGDTLDLRLVSADHLRRLNDDNLRHLLDAIDRQPQKIYFLPAQSRRARLHFPWRDKRENVSSVAALALQMYGRGEVDLVKRMLLLRPVSIAADLHEIVPQIFTLEVVTQALKEMIPQLTNAAIDWDYPEDIQADGMGNMLEAFFIVHGRENKDLIDAWTMALLVKLEEAGFGQTTENLGVLTGLVIAGGLKYANWIRAGDQATYYRIDKGSQLVWAATQCINTVPVLPGGFAIVAVASGIFLEHLYPVRDMSSTVTRLEGKLRARLLKLQIFRTRYELDRFLGWIDTIKLCNGLN